MALNTLSKEIDLFLLQEHWLFNFELDNLETFIEGFTSTGKAVDDTNPIMPTAKPRGYGGTATLWRNTLTEQIKVIPDGDHRILGITVNNNTDTPWLIANVYLPSRGGGRIPSMIFKKP